METVLSKTLGHNVSEKEREEARISLANKYLCDGLLLAKLEQLDDAEEHFMLCVELLENKELQSETVFPVIHALNQLSIIWYQADRPTTAKYFLDQATQIYYDFKKTNKPCIFSASLLDLMAKNFSIERITDEKSPDEALEQVHTLTLYYLAQVHRKLQDDYQSAVYLHMTLHRQLGINSITQDLDYIDWALNAAQLSLYFMRDHIFPVARHQLAAASYILQKYKDILKQKTTENGESEALAADWEMFKRTSANVATYWGKYGILLLDSSVERLVEQAKPDKKNDESNNEDSSKSKMADNLRFDILEKEIEPIANQVTDKYVEGFDDARLVFLNAQKWLQQAKAYYTLENYASNHILIVQDISAAYKCLSFFEEHEDRKARMHKRRIDILEDVIKELNPQYYESACREIWMELAAIYSSILYIKLIRLESSKKEPTQQVLRKINNLAKSAIKYLQAYIDSIRTSNSNFEMEQIPDDLLGLTLLAYYHIGKLYRTIIPSDKAILVKNMQNSINAYKFVVNYINKYPEASESMAIEQFVMKSAYCKELVQLLELPPNLTQLTTFISDP